MIATVTPGKKPFGVVALLFRHAKVISDLPADPFSIHSLSKFTLLPPTALQLDRVMLLLVNIFLSQASEPAEAFNAGMVIEIQSKFFLVRPCQNFVKGIYTTV